VSHTGGSPGFAPCALSVAMPFAAPVERKIVKHGSWEKSGADAQAAGGRTVRTKSGWGERFPKPLAGRSSRLGGATKHHRRNNPNADDDGHLDDKWRAPGSDANATACDGLERCGTRGCCNGVVTEHLVRPRYRGSGRRARFGAQCARRGGTSRLR